MTWVHLLLRFGALFLSLLGYTGFARAFLAVPRYYAYLFSVSVIALAMYFAGLLGALTMTAYVLLGLGLLLFLIVLVTRRFDIAFRRPALNMINVTFILWFWVTFASLLSYKLIHYDNFSHWAMVVKQMLVTDSIPNAASRLIDFKNYPLGTSSFLYFVCKIVGNQEGVMLVGQQTLIFACFYAFFGVIRDHKRFLLAALLGLCCAVMSYFNISIRVNNLLVDYLLPLYALGAIAGMTEGADRYRTACLSSIPVLGMLLVIKNTGVFFAIPAFFYLIYAGGKTRRGRPFAYQARSVLGAIVTIALACIPLAAWSVHTAQTFAQETSKFSIDFSSLLNLDWTNLMALIPDKTPEQVQTIVSLYGRAVTSLDTLATQGMLLINMLAIVAWLNARFGFGMRWKLLRVLLLMDVLMAVYYAGILAFYLIAMPAEEALRLAGFERYASSMMMFALGAVGMCLVRDVECSLYVQQGEERDYHAFKTIETKRIYQFATLAAFGIAMLFLVTDITGMNQLQENYPATLPAHAETVLGNHWSGEDDRRYLLYAPDTDRQITDDYLGYVGRYMLFAPNVRATASAEPALLDELQNYDYFVIVESDAAVQAFMQQNTGLAGNVGVYAVQETFATSLAASTP